MADIKTSELTEITSLSSGDLFNISLDQGGSTYSSRSLTASNLHAAFSNFVATTSPTSSNDTTEGYLVGSLWVDVTNDVSYICLDNSSGAAVWSSIGNSLFSLTGTDIDGGTSSNRMTNIDFWASNTFNFDCGTTGVSRYFMTVIYSIGYFQLGYLDDSTGEFTGFNLDTSGSDPEFTIVYENSDYIEFTPTSMIFNEDLDITNGFQIGLLNASDTRVAGLAFDNALVGGPILSKDSTVSPFYFTGTGTEASTNGYYFVSNQSASPTHYLDIESDKLTIFTDVYVEDGSTNEVLSIDNATGDLSTDVDITCSGSNTGSYALQYTNTDTATDLSPAVNTWTAVPIFGTANTSISNGDNFTVDSSTQITANADLVIRVSSNIYYNSSANSRVVGQCQLEINGSNVGQIASESYTRNTTVSEGSVGLNSMRYTISNGQTLRLMFRTETGSATTNCTMISAGTSFILVEEV